MNTQTARLDTPTEKKSKAFCRMAMEVLQVSPADLSPLQNLRRL